MKRIAFILCLLLAQATGMELRPVPWLTEGAIEYLSHFFQENPEAVVLEFGSGASTVWISKRTPNLYSVEHNPAWHNIVKKHIESNAECHPALLYLVNLPYYRIADQFPDEYFDLVLVDGRNRKGCICACIKKLKKGGTLMLDNAERPYYFAVFPRMKGWPRYNAYQTEPDSCGFLYPGWLTSWWIKPLN